jgi:DNA polymerase III alpha subunit (gram-positive type)
LRKELAVIEDKDFPGYFLIVHDMVKFARDKGILCQGRGSAANSVVCYVLGITAVDPITFKLPFERFLSATRDEEPDIDVDFDSDRREEVIQEVYQRLWASQCRPGSQRDQLPAAVRGSRHGEGAGILHRPTGRLVQADRYLGDAPGQ